VSRAETETLAAHEVAPVRDPLVAVELELPQGTRFAAVARLVAAGLGARLGLSVERLEDLRAAIDAALRQPSSCDTLTLAMTPTPDELEIEIGPLAAGALDSRGLHVLSTLVDETETRQSGSDVWIAMRLARPRSRREPLAM
jgi:serine/threonine-protein kinase RsbW